LLVRTSVSQGSKLLVEEAQRRVHRPESYRMGIVGLELPLTAGDATHQGAGSEHETHRLALLSLRTRDPGDGH